MLKSIRASSAFCVSIVNQCPGMPAILDNMESPYRQTKNTTPLPRTPFPTSGKPVFPLHTQNVQNVMAL